MQSLDHIYKVAALGLALGLVGCPDEAPTPTTPITPSIDPVPTEPTPPEPDPEAVVATPPPGPSTDEEDLSFREARGPIEVLAFEDADRFRIPQNGDLVRHRQRAITVPSWTDEPEQTFRFRTVELRPPSDDPDQRPWSYENCFGEDDYGSAIATFTHPRTQPRCFVTLRNEHLYSVACRAVEEPNRAPRAQYTRVCNIAIRDATDEETEDEFYQSWRRVTAWSAFIPGFTTIRERLRAECARVGLSACGLRGSISLTPTGLRVNYPLERSTREVDFPWSDVDRVIKADSDLGRALLRYDGVGTVEIPPPRENTGGTVGRGLELGIYATERAAAVAWRALDAARRERARFAWTPLQNSRDRRLRLVLPFDSDEEHDALVEQFGELPTAQFVSSASPREVRAQRDIIARYGPAVPTAFQTWPEGTFGLALEGHVPALELLDDWASYFAESRLGRRGSWVRIVGTGTDAGWVAASFVRPYEGCTPRPETFLESMGEQRESAQSTHLVAALTEGDERLAIFAAETGPEEARRTALAIYRMDPECAVGERLADATIEGGLRGLGFPPRTHDSEERVAVVAYGPSYGEPTLEVRSMRLETLFTHRFTGQESMAIELHTGEGRGDEYRLARVQTGWNHETTTFRFRGERVVLVP